MSQFYLSPFLLNILVERLVYLKNEVGYVGKFTKLPEGVLYATDNEITEDKFIGLSNIICFYAKMMKNGDFDDMKTRLIFPLPINRKKSRVLLKLINSDVLNGLRSFTNYNEIVDHRGNITGLIILNNNLVPLETVYNLSKEISEAFNNEENPFYSVLCEPLEEDLEKPCEDIYSIKQDDIEEIFDEGCLEEYYLPHVSQSSHEENERMFTLSAYRNFENARFGLDIYAHEDTFDVIAEYVRDFTWIDEEGYYTDNGDNHMIRDRVRSKIFEKEQEIGRPLYLKEKIDIAKRILN